MITTKFWSKWDKELKISTEYIMDKRTTTILLFALIIGYFAPRLCSQDLKINEVMAGNATTIADEDGDYPDWLELYNNGNDPIHLKDYGLSDNENDPFKWVFPNAIIQPQQHLLIFASEKNRRIIISHWETVINWGATWKYRQGNANITLDVSPKMGGLIKLSTIAVEKYPWQGNYFMNTPLPVKAIPHANYKFSRWQGINTSNSDAIVIKLTGTTLLTAVFEPITGTSESVVINEINYNSSSSFNPGDWLELNNNSETSIDISGWQLKDAEDNHIFYIPPNVVFPAHEYLVLCRDTLSFKTYFPGVHNIIGNLDFGLNRNGEAIRLYNEANIIMDSLTYNNRHPWPIMPDGGGPTLALKNPGMDNALPVSWSASRDHGTPGTKNDIYIELSVNSFPTIPMAFHLYPNYPNPFNATTTISYQLPGLSLVNISIYNV